MVICKAHSVHVFEDARTMPRDEDHMEVILHEDVHSKEEVMAFGDSQNDKDMLLAAGESYAMETASQEIKQAAKYTAPNWEHNGVYETIKNRVL